MTEPRILLANEAGSGRGHVTVLGMVGRALGQGLPIVAALASQKYASEFGSLCERVLRAPPLRYTPEALADPTLEGNATWGDYLAACGFAREEVVRRGLDWWRRTIVDEDISLLVADYAPLAMRAAQGLKADGWEIQILSTGTGYGVPPSHLERFPVLLPEYRRVVHPEETILALVNRVGAEMALDPLPWLPAIYEADLALPFTFPFLDPYDEARAEGEVFPPVVENAREPADGSGDELFVYFAGRELHEPSIVDALASLPLKRRGFLPGAPPQTVARLAASGMIIEAAPISAEAITRRSRLMLNSAQHGTICMAALAGVPQVALPRHLEQLFHGRRAESQGILRLLVDEGRSAEAIGSLIMEAWSDVDLSEAARELALDLRASYPADPGTALAARVAPVLGRARQASS